MQVIIKHLVAFFNLSVPLILLYFIAPRFLFSLWGILCCSLLFGFYVGLYHYNSGKKLASGLRFEPTGKNKEFFDGVIRSCGIDPRVVQIRYAYAGDNIATTTFNTVVIDPTIWLGLESDPVLVDALNVIEGHVLPGLSGDMKVLWEKIKGFASPLALRFIFKHELGHVVCNYSYKTVFLAGLTSFFVAGSALWAASAVVVTAGAAAALLTGIFVGAFLDLFFSYVQNWLFKSVQEREADMFAVQFSTGDEIEAAAVFFEQYENMAKEHRQKSLSGFQLFIPQVFLIGYEDGACRVRRLRSLRS